MTSSAAVVVSFMCLFAIVIAEPFQIPYPGSPLLSNQILVESPKPYEFGYEFGDGLGMTQHRRESADGIQGVQGTYGYRDPNGVYRNVEYRADSDGYRATIRSNEPGLGNSNAANAIYVVEPPPPAAVATKFAALSPVIPVFK